MQIERVNYTYTNNCNNTKNHNNQLYNHIYKRPQQTVNFMGVKEYLNQKIDDTKKSYDKIKESISDFTQLFSKNHVELTKEQAEFIQSYEDLENAIKAKYAKKISEVKDGFWDRFGNYSEKKRAKLREEERKELATAASFQSVFEQREKESLELKRKFAIAAADLNFSKEIIVALENAMATNEKRLEIIKRKQELAKNSGFSQLAGYMDEKIQLQTGFIDRLDDEKSGKYEADVIPNAILFYGPTGCGKTTFANSLAQEADCNFVQISCHGSQSDREKQFMNQMFGYTDNRGKEHKGIADIAQENFLETGQRTIVLVDEFDRFFGNGVSNKFINGLKGFMDSCSEDYHVTLFLTSNIPQKIPYELRNSHRTGIIVNLDPPNEQNTKEVLKYYLENTDSEDIDYNKLSKELFVFAPDEIYSNTHLKTICDIAVEDIKPANEKLTTDMILKAIKQYNESNDNHELLRITKKYLDAYEDDKKNI